MDWRSRIPTLEGINGDMVDELTDRLMALASRQHMLEFLAILSNVIDLAAGADISCFLVDEKLTDKKIITAKLEAYTQVIGIIENLINENNKDSFYHARRVNAGLDN